ncbi:hypothetical protein OJF2_47450 [Aquisphaera giovannonii]|uniref:Uncharacterized protein n=1 Tax=Aquisphaera giovannonii TaxID=406548 RepID=A0A5B9W7X0_9BACT|nr:hypothetical protein [Aquisphaera giovannonii]QEH36185.1 hypothetical protein OJF2_47450 [Aquisphaera giovannonii]
MFIPLRRAFPALALAILAGGTGVARAQAMALSASRLLEMSGPDLDALYRQGRSVGLPAGRVRGTAILAPGTRRNEAMAAGTRLVWQGKVYNPAEAVAVNRFFGLPIVKARVYQAESWLDGSPSLILDYSQTSRIYARNRDEIREIAPGLYLGLMYARTSPQPTLKMYFVLEAQP